MASRSSSRAPGGHGGSAEADGSLLSNALTAVSGSNISSFSRKVTSTAGSLISPFSDTLVPGNHYHNAMTEISKTSRRPSLQKRIFSFSERTPSEIVRSTLSTTEIQYRALTYLPDTLLNDIPENDTSYSLFQGFQASVEVPKKSRKKGDPKNLIESSTDAGPSSSGSPALAKLNKERASVNRQLDLLGIRKNIASSEIREIDGKLQSLALMRGLVLERLAKLEQDEASIEHDLLDLDNRIEDLQYDIEDDNAAPSVQSDDESRVSEPSAGFMSESIYGKLPSPRNRKHRVAAKRKSMPILHEHMAPGTMIKEIQCHSDIITCHDFDYPFGTLVTAALDDTVRVWDLSSGRCLGMLEGHHASVRCLQVEDSFLATGSMDATIRFWDLSRAEQPSSQASPKVPGSSLKKATDIEEEEEEEEDDFSMFSKEPAPSSLSTQDCHLLTLDSHIGEVTALYFQGRNLVSGSADKTIRQWDLETGRCIQTLDVLWAAAQSTTPSMDDGSWGRAKSKTNLRALHHDEADFIGALQCFDAALACGTADGMVRLWDLRSGQVHRSLVGHTAAVTCLQFDDLHLVTGSLDRSIRIWDLRTGSISDAFAYEHPITSMQFDPRRIVSAAGENVAKVYDKAESRHWNCGAGAAENTEERLATPSIVETVRCKEGYLVEGRRDGIIGIWTC